MGMSCSSSSRRVLLAVKVEDHPLAYGEFEATFERKRHGAQTVLPVVHELEVFAIRVAELGGVVGDDDRARA